MSRLSGRLGHLIPGEQNGSRNAFATRYAYVLPTPAARAKYIRPYVRLSGEVRNQHKFYTTTSSPALVPPSHIPKRAITNTISKAESTGKLLRRDEYEKLRAQDGARLSAASYLHVMAEALKCNNSKLAERVVTDILEAFHGQDVERDNLLRTIFSEDISLISRHTVLRMLQHLERSPTGLSFLTTAAVGRLVRMISHTSKIRDTDRPFLRLLHPLLLERLETLLVPESLRAVNFRPSDIIYTCFIITYKLLCLSFDQHALDLFQALVKSRHIPPKALQAVDGSSEDVKLIICTALIRASLHWNWRALAAAFVMDLLTPTSPPDKLIIDLNIDAIYALLDNPTPCDIRACGHLIRRVHRHSPVPSSVIRQFYHSAAAVEARAEAEYMYAFTRCPSMLRHHRYPPPQGVALPWLMLHLTTTSSQTHLARTLAKEVVDDNHVIPILFRARFIAKVASQGYGRLARTLWERYAIGVDGEAVAANPALLIRMVSLFWNIHTRTEAELQNPRSGRKGRPQVEAEELEMRSDDAAQFVDRVMEAFKYHHAPLAKAPHYVLTSLARACFIVGKIPEGFGLFKFLLDRKEAPDLYDVNVALTAVAQLNPKLGIKLIERMVEAGLQPDAVSFGTALHHAVLQGEQEVVDVIFKHIRGFDNEHVSVKTFASFVNASLSYLRKSSKEDVRTALVNILHLIDSYPEANFASAPQTAKTLLYSALQAEDGPLAYRIWKRLLQRSAEWEDAEQHALRHRIALLIQRPESQLKNQHIRIMLAQLGQSG
ncbi:hypothetical protein D9615_003006 [Tricholomella constricta]|uniref:Pentatricopeptide repeat protein n=1 Tax=Tricholomella constricta TaxID=117010 RepID=A0A8H5HFR7_9AGAR|nr:hypothetical protein D9615_003006 [Tricholomella constricta]